MKVDKKSIESSKASVEWQNISIMVRVRLLFLREIRIDLGGGTRLFDQSYLLRLVEAKKSIDQQTHKTLSFSVVITLLLYLLIQGLDPKVPLWNLSLSSVPGVFVFLSLLASYSLALSVYSFFNSQTYSALIDQVILLGTGEGLLDGDLFKAGLTEEWLLFKALRRDFSFYAPPDLVFGRIGKTVSLIVFVVMCIVTLMPFIALVVAIPILAAVSLPDDWIGVVTEIFVYLCAFSIALLLIASEVQFPCQIKSAAPETPEKRA